MKKEKRVIQPPVAEAEKSSYLMRVFSMVEAIMTNQCRQKGHQGLEGLRYSKGGPDYRCQEVVQPIRQTTASRDHS